MTTIKMPGAVSRLLLSARDVRELKYTQLGWIHVETTADRAVFVTTNTHILAKVVAPRKLIEAGDYLPGKRLANTLELNPIVPEKSRSFPTWMRAFPSEDYDQEHTATLRGSAFRAHARFCVDTEYLTILAATGYNWKITQREGKTKSVYTAITESMEPEWSITVLIMPVKDTE